MWAAQVLAGEMTKVVDIGSVRGSVLKLEQGASTHYQLGRVPSLKHLKPMRKQTSRCQKVTLAGVERQRRF